MTDDLTSAVHRPSGPWDMAKAVGAVADFMGVSPYRVPDKVTAHDGVPWSMYSALEIAYKAGKEARHD